MHCPDCGQQQVSEETRFCSRCGLSLSLISEVVANRGTLPQLAELKKKKKKFLTKKTGIFIGIVWTLFFLLVVAVSLRALKAPGELISIVVVFGLFSGAMIMFGSGFFLESESASHDRYDEYPEPNRRDLNASRPGALPPQRSVPAQNYAPPAGKNRWETNDLAQPSVTEGTTKLLQKEEDQ